MDYNNLLKYYIKKLTETHLVFVDEEVFEILIDIYKKRFKDGYDDALEEIQDLDI